VPTEPKAGVRLNSAPAFEGKPTIEPTSLRRRRQEVLLAVLLNHPFLLSEVEQDFAEISLAPDLDRLRHEILRLHPLNPELDAAGLKLHLSKTGFAEVVQGILSPQILSHAAFARPDADADTVRMGWAHTREQLEERHLRQQIADAAQVLVEDVNEENWARVRGLQAVLEAKKDDDSATGGGVG